MQYSMVEFLPSLLFWRSSIVIGLPVALARAHAMALSSGESSVELLLSDCSFSVFRGLNTEFCILT